MRTENRMEILPAEGFKVSLKLWSQLGFTIELPDESMFVEESSAGPETEQISLPGDVLLTVVRDDDLVHTFAEAIEWSEKMAMFYEARPGGNVLAQGQLRGADKDTYAVLVGFTGADGEPLIAATVAMRFRDAFFGLTILWPVINLELEPDFALVRRTVTSFHYSTKALIS